MSGCRYPKYDFTFNLYYSSRQMFATVLTHPGIDSYFINIDRMGSVPVTVDNGDFRTFCGGTTDALILGQAYTVVNGDNYPLKSADGTVLFDNYGGCFQDDGGNYYVRRGMVVQSSEPDGSLGIMQFNNSSHGAYQLNCVECAATSFARIYHPDVYTWVVAPEDTSTLGLPWMTAYRTDTGTGTDTGCSRITCRFRS